MMPTSLGGRLLAGSALFIVIALVFTLLLMHQVLERFVTGQIDQRLDDKIVSLASQVRVARDGTVALAGDADGPPFDTPRHQSFWVVQGPKNSLHTAWLGEHDFVPPAPNEIEALPQPPERHAPGPRGGPALAPAHTIVGPGPEGLAMHVRVERRTIALTAVTIFVAAPRSAITDPMREAMTSIGIGTAGLGLALFLATLVQIKLGLLPLTRLRSQVAAIRDGHESRLPLDQPSEIQPLVVELNSLLAQNAETLARARRHVANLAHGLKTPLATLALAVDRLPSEEAPALRDLVGLIERRIRHHLGRARSAALGGPARVRTCLSDRVRDVIVALERIYATKEIVSSLEGPPDVWVACEPQDLDEIIGNVLDNAFKFAARRVACTLTCSTRTVAIEIRDDGPGLEEAEIERVMRPGQRLDEDIPGFGFGLSIARELAELYAGSIALRGLDQGLSVTIILPRA